ncbi:MAG: hypothetical protein MZW92_66270 [Comamonadaceae bacterium]|nr:hypothetical protein [Comamonadaceae bacterium]
MTCAQIIVLATPVFLALIALEFARRPAHAGATPTGWTTRCRASAWA